MEITNWYFFTKILSCWVLSFVFSYMTFREMRKKKVYLFRKIIWGLACFWLVIDGLMDLLFSTTNVFSYYESPLITRGVFVVLILIEVVVSLVYFQWNIMCVYQINDKPVPVEKQPLLQKGSAMVMYMMLIVHLGIYGLFIQELYQ